VPARRVSGRQIALCSPRINHDFSNLLCFVSPYLVHLGRLVQTNLAAERFVTEKCNNDDLLPDRM
jgi:hypothetical protein